MTISDSLFNLLRAECGASVWSQAVGLAREATIQQASPLGSVELVGRIKPKQSPRSFRAVVHLEDESWECDCSEGDPCAHVAALAIAARNGSLVTGDGATDSNRTSAKSVDGGAKIQYELRIADNELMVARSIIAGGESVDFVGNLKNYVGGLQSNRLKGTAIHCINEDFILDELISTYGGKIRKERLLDYFRLLAPCGSVWFLDRPIEVSASPIDTVVEVIGEGADLLVRRERGEGCTFPFPGTTLVDDTLYYLRIPELPGALRQATSIDGIQIKQRDIGAFLANTLPELEKHIRVAVKVTSKLPEISDAQPRISFFHRTMDGFLWVTPKIIYGEPVIAEIAGDELVVVSKNQIPRRNKVAELALARELQNAFSMKPGYEVAFKGNKAALFIEQSARWEHEGDISARQLVRSSRIEPEVSLTNNGALSLQFGVQQHRFSYEQVRHAQKHGDSWLPLEGCGWFELPSEWLQNVFTPLSGLLDLHENGLLSDLHKPFVADVLQSLEISIPKELAKYALPDGAALLLEENRPLPPDLACELRPYQTQGVRWIEQLHSLGLGAVLADDMGLGKTVQALCVVRGHALVIAPTSVLVAWEQQATAFRPNLSVLVYHGSSRELSVEPNKNTLVLTSFALARRDAEILSAIDWDLLIVDEAQMIKNAESLTAEAIYTYSARRRLVLSGTPVENSLADIWSVFHTALPGLLPDLNSFRSLVRNESYMDVLKRKVRPFILRRLKTDVAQDLPERTELVLRCSLNEDEQIRYAAMISTAKEKLAAEGVTFSSVLEALLRLRQLCCSHLLLPEQFGDPLSGFGSKVDLLIEAVVHSIENGHQCLIFSQWTSMLDIIERALQAAGVSWLRLDGSTKDRASVVEQFQSGGDSGESASVMLVSLKAGGTGLTLTRADHVYVVDPWWNPAVERQATDRAHRIGQQRPVVIYKLVAENTVEERILALQAAKKDISNEFLDGVQGNGAQGDNEVSLKELVALFG
jgi:superfamily II DNA or RNA helicase